MSLPDELSCHKIQFYVTTSYACGYLEGRASQSLVATPHHLVSQRHYNDLIKKGYELLNLITYFTTGEKETRAWTIGRGQSAPEAGTAIHGDFKDKFVRAEVIEWDKLLASGSYGAAREKGLVRTEGKEYIVKDGDVIEFKI